MSEMSLGLAISRLVSGACFTTQACVRGNARGHEQRIGVSELWKTLLGRFHKRVGFLE